VVELKPAKSIGLRRKGLLLIRPLINGRTKGLAVEAVVIVVVACVVVVVG